MNKEITIRTTDGFIWYGNTTHNSIDFEYYEWINGAIYIHFQDGNIHTFNPSHEDIASIQTSYGGLRRDKDE